MEIRTDRKIAVIGAGTMGVGIAQIASAAGHAVVVIDQNAVALDRGKQALQGALDQLVERQRMGADSALAVAERICWSCEIADVAGSALAIEAIVERLDAKCSLFAQLETHMDASAVLASNTSSLSIADIAAPLAHPARLIGLHFFNPVPAMKLVEIISLPNSDPDIVAAATDLMKQWGKYPVIVRDVPGFIVNRVARPYYSEAFAAWEEGLAPELIDHAMTGSGGFRMGPLTLADLIGHDINYAAASSVHDGMVPNVRFRPQPAQARLVEKGELGRKTGRGVYDYGFPLPPPPSPLNAPAMPVSIAPHAGALAGLKALLQADEDPTLPPETMMIGNIRAALGDGRSLGARQDVDILIDYALDFATSGVLVVTTRDTAGERAAESLAAMLGKALVLIPDRPGQIVLRTYAQLANAAMDAVHDKVAGADAIDDAMRFGANYPVGPIAWIRQAGPERVRQALSHIARETGDPFYIPADHWEMI
jgi:3-hydroxybutyryl-CoA dehydrogenase